MEENNNKINNNMPSQKSIFEQDIEMKQNLIKSTIIDKNYDKNAFFNFCMNKKKEGGDDLANWTIEELNSTINEFCEEQNKILLNNQMIEEQYKRQRELAQNIHLNMGDFNQNYSYYQNQNLNQNQKPQNLSRVVAFFHGIYAVEGRIWRKNEKRSIWGDYLFFNELVSEKKTIEKSDRIIMLNVRDENEAYEIYKRKADLLLPMFIEDTANIVESDCDSNEFRILFVGGFFGPNVEGIRWFAQRVMPLLDDRYHLYIVGNGMEELRNEQLMQKNNIHIIGRVDDLSEWYNSSECVIGPIFYGDGMKTKTAEALMYGKIFLGTEEAICGYDELANYQCDTETEFATAIKKVCKKNGSKYHQDMRDIYLSRYSIDAVKQQVGDLLEGLLK